MVNRLKEATSPYLQQHADNPVDWWPYGEEAFAEARRRDVPVLLSVGYAACHWCHVMAHESFEDEVTAALINDHTVAVKVDREERPDVDAVYMEATQAMTGQGGWPMTVFCTPDGEPFYTGTYFPRDNFQRLVVAVAAAWRDNRDEAVAQGRKVVEALTGGELGPGRPLAAELLDAAADSLRRSFDVEHAGFGGAPKFPPSMSLEFLVRQHARTRDERSLTMVTATAAAMAQGGMYDQLGGGFARYSVDATWTVPHFEKMLYDNGLLLRAYTHVWRATGSEQARRVAAETAEFLLRDLRTDAGGFASSLDADTAGVEGRTYVWTPAQLIEALGPEDGTWVANLTHVTDIGTFEHGTSVLQLPDDPYRDAADGPRWARLRTALFAARSLRAQPGRDDKVVAAWNGLAIAGLAEFGALTGGPEGAALVAAAVTAGELLLRLHTVDGRLLRTSRDGRAGANAGVLEDYGDVADAYLSLHQVTGEARWLEAAGALLDVALEQFPDGSGGFYDTAADAERLIRRPQDPTDNATPAGASAVASALVTYAALTGSSRHREAAEAALAKVAPVVEQHARFAGWAAAAGEALLAGPLQVAVVGSGPQADALAHAARWSASPGAVVVAGAPDAAGVPLLADRPLVDGGAAAYLCRGFVCERPTTDPDALAAQMR